MKFGPNSTALPFGRALCEEDKDLKKKFKTLTEIIQFVCMFTYLYKRQISRTVPALVKNQMSETCMYSFRTKLAFYDELKDRRDRGALMKRHADLLKIFS